MSIKNHISFKHKGEIPKSKHQYVTERDREYYTGNEEELERELWRFYFDGFLNQDMPSLSGPFMEFHLHHCQDKLDFLEFVKLSPRRMPYMYVPDLAYLEQELHMERAYQWVEKKRKVVERMSEEDRDNLGETRIKPRREDEIEPVSIWETLAFFKKKLVRPVKVGSKLLIMEEKDVEEFVFANFHGHSAPPARRRFKTNGYKKDILKAVDEFYCTVDTHTLSIRAYCYMLIDVFDEFKTYIDKETGEYKLDALGKHFADYRELEWRKKRW